MEKKPFHYPIDQPFNDLKYRTLYNYYQVRLSEYFSKDDALGVLESSLDIPMSLRDIYVPLRLDDKDIVDINSSEEVEKQTGFSVEEAILSSQFIAISGNAGSGKSTLTKYLATATAANDDAIVHSIGRRIVLPFILRELDLQSVPTFEGLLEQFTQKMAEDLNLESMGLSPDFFDFYIRQGWAIIILDGFDELGDLQNETLIRLVCDYIKEKNLEAQDLKTTVIITGRPTGFLSGVDYSRFETRYLMPFNQKEIETFTTNFFALRHGHNKRKEQAVRKDFLGRLDEFKGLDELKHRPIYLAMLVYIWEVDGELPYTRTIAYSKMIHAYLHQLEMKKNFDEKKPDFPLPLGLLMTNVLSWKNLLTNCIPEQMIIKRIPGRKRRRNQTFKLPLPEMS